MNKRTALLGSLLLFAILVTIYLVYPIWLAFPSASSQLAYYAAALVVVVSSFFCFEKLALKTSAPKEKSDFRVWLAIFAILLLTHSWAMSMPLAYPGDEDYHLGRAAYLFKPLENVLKDQGLPWLGCLAFLVLIALTVWLVLSWKKISPLLYALHAS